eukprot:TRINITY_DN4123_c0_g1_i2.p1 TRINITY_DN4123_c0_g1~~TRINITY_DN4123_c0_g1_i2.p1  ORF type:complete len:158 (+),score=29.41 TRINITY_DN4123_c0_g1_i2:239-712(+)
MSITLALLKPDFLRRKGNSDYDYVMKKAHEVGLKVLTKKRLARWKASQIEEFYQEFEGLFFYERLIFSMSSGKVEGIVFQHDTEDAIKVWRDLIGPTHLYTAKTTRPDSLRAKFATSDTRNSFHGSDSHCSAIREMKIFFPEFTPPVSLECEVKIKN